MDKAPDASHLVKVGLQSADDPLKFILSTDSVDRMGDIVEQDWQLKDFKKNPIALVQHDHTNPIGVWKDLKIEAGKLVGTLKLAKEGTSSVVDTVRSLIEQHILKAVSVGFSVGSYEARYDEDGNFQGYLLQKPSLHEASVVSVPANQEALQIAKAFNLSNSDMSNLFLPEQKSDDVKVEIDPLQAQKNKMKLLNLSAR